MNIVFVRADRMLTGNEPEIYPEHVISFGWEDYSPELVTMNMMSGELTTVGLDEIDWLISPSRRCVGRFTGEGHVPCPDGRIVVRFDQCERCASSWIEHQECIFEPRCDGSICGSDICSRKHVVYAAFHGDVLKIGMTSGTRLRERGIEQGADAIAPLVDCRNRKDARETENIVSHILKARQTINKKESLRALLKAPRAGKYESLYDDALKRIRKSVQVKDAPLEVLNGYPVGEWTDSVLTVSDLEGKHRGKVVAIKGKFLVYRTRSEGRLKVLQLSAMPSRSIRRM